MRITTFAGHASATAGARLQQAGNLPVGVVAETLSQAADGIGHELVTGNSGGLPRWQQWNAVHALPGSLRGVHVHLRRFDYLVILRGSMWLGLHDTREDVASAGASVLLHLQASETTAWVIPPGVAHGFCFTEDTDFCFALSEIWAPEGDEFGCRWDDPALNLVWPVEDPAVSPRDRDAGSLSELRRTLAMRRLDTPRGGRP